ncbi:transglutaminase-like cysteine peptidase [Roseospira navarrensis]|nr:transglutaminase-like cysteine peptidase [Roseospira navarrensis]
MAGLLVLLPLAGSPAVAAAGDGLFGSEEIANGDLTPFVRWTEVLERIETERAIASGGAGAACRTRDYDACAADRWRAMLDPLRDLDRDAQLAAVNAALNRGPYVQDSANYGVSDYWATPGQFLARHGDCEDYAIAKYMALRDLGWSPALLRIVVLQDLNLDVPHAVLAVRLGGKSYILDNQILAPVTDDRIAHYQPLYSVNERRWWRHRTPGFP